MSVPTWTLTLSNYQEPSLIVRDVGCFESNCGNDCADRRCLRGHRFVRNNPSVLWKSQRQRLIAMLTVESEIITFLAAYIEGLWLCQLQMDIHKSQNHSPHMLKVSDNLKDPILALAVMIKARTKYIDMCYPTSWNLQWQYRVYYHYAQKYKNFADVVLNIHIKDQLMKFPKSMDLWLWEVNWRLIECCTEGFVTCHCRNMNWCRNIMGHLQAVEACFLSALAIQHFKKVHMAITSCSFVCWFCSTMRSIWGECCIYCSILLA